jgi:multidrug resistance efflux pump
MPAMRWKKVLAAGGVLIAVAAGLGFWWPFGRPARALKLPGLVEIQEVRLGSKVGGRVEKVSVAEGDLVAEGDELVRIEVPELKRQRDQLQAKLRQAEWQLKKAEEGPRPQEVYAAEAAMKVARWHLKKIEEGNRPEEKRLAQSEFEAADADWRLAQDEYDRAQRLYRRDATAKADFDTARANLQRGLGRLQAARARLDLMNAGSRTEEVEEGRAELERLTTNYELLKAGTRDEEKEEARARRDETRARLQEIEVQIEEAVVKAPEAAVIEVVAVRKGDLVPPNQPILRVLRAADLWVKIYVPETDLGRVRLHQKVEVTVDGYGDRRFQGEVVQISSVSEFTPRNVQSVDERKHQVFGVRVRVSDPQGVFKSGMAAEVHVPLAD